MSTNGGNDLFMDVFSYQTTPYQKKINGVTRRAVEQGYKRVLPDLIRIEQDSKRFLTRRLTAPE